MSWIEEDARHLALELTGLAPAQTLDAMPRGVVLEAGERASREISVELRHQSFGSWSIGMAGVALVTDRRLLVKACDGRVTSLWWGSLVWFEPNLPGGHVVLDYGDGVPRLVSSREVAAVAVMGVMALYGAVGLTEHPALEPLRVRS